MLTLCKKMATFTFGMALHGLVLVRLSDQKDRRVSRDRRANRAFRESKVSRVTLGILDRRAFKERLVLLVPRAHRGGKASKVFRVKQDPRGTLETLDLRVQRVILEQLELVVL
jgi:hypothetical protein